MDPQTLAVAQEIDFSMWGLFARATLTVKLVMLMLVLSSVWGWAIIFEKIVSYRHARREAARFDRAFWSGEPLDELYDQIGADPKGRAQRVFAAGMTEWRRSHRDDGGLIAGAHARIDRSMDVAIQKESEELQRGLPVLATVASAAPFVGLFGTVWGIMHAFIEIANQQDTSLVVVAPGIAEALFATALGLVAAIPAVIFYNKLSADANRVIAGYEAFADEFSTILSRQLDS
ncbi:MAG: protein TolQ [Salipiger thiooxidans]|jgi:biopolymer transport protein TolQ|uniref:Tol-Pal system protein TolQ n=1 Tax=Salipiger thiooxidans TaxID=282683 RepID=A0A1G7L6V8_9RHOB|nr:MULTISPECIES: protein TolQ [Salipiger]EEX13114.1 protein TolQ [Citreicella sp. SE45]MAU48275.1 protein TolQ [Salipiger sp.]MBR9839763.1 protein TolQ [Paracoccaceae bacterium]MBN8189702.1 protein TolQ [Salipiger thiooxidans]MCA0849606.1 protein TolQ [Salipiger thiooxidans]